MLVSMKKMVSGAAMLAFLFGMFAAPAAASPAGAEAAGATEGYALSQIAGGKLLKPFTLAGAYDDHKINNILVADPHAAFLWDKGTGSFAPVALSREGVVGNFVRLWDVTGDEAADILEIVSWEDSKDYWDGGMHWNEDFDDGGAFSDGQKWRIPYGERLLVEYGPGGAAEDFSNILAYGDLQGSTYWPLHDYYNTASGGALTMLTGFRTTQQATGWACGPTSALMVLDWFGFRKDLNEQDLAALRKHPRQAGATNLQQMVNIFDGLNELHDLGKGKWGKWEILSSYDIVEKYEIEKPEGGKYSLSSVEELMDGSLFRGLLSDGIPILIGWNSFGGHWQVIIGYDDMGSEDTKDHVLILADPYDSTDHRNDGYTVQSLERFVYDWSAGFDPDFEHGIFVAAVPENWEFCQLRGKGLTDYKEGYDGCASDERKLGYGRTAADIEKYYPETPWRGSNGLAGAATGGYERVPNDYVNVSPYYAHYDYFNWKSGESPAGGGGLVILENFRTQQQTTEWTCGLTSALMAMEWYNANHGLSRLLDAFTEPELAEIAGKYKEVNPDALRDTRFTEINLARLRGEDRLKPGATTLDDMIHIFDSLNEDEGYLYNIARANGWGTLKKWAVLTSDDLTEDLSIESGDGGEHFLEGGAGDGGLIPYYLGLGYPVLAGWNEWGGHWQVIIGYDDLGTEGTQDDVLILADPYDTTDHNQDGYYLESFERLVYGWTADFDPRGEYVFLIPYLVDTGIPVK